jgi:hypothetical protein
MQKIALLIIVLGIFFNGFSQNKKIQQVQLAIETLKKAMIEADSTTLVSLLSNQLTYGHSGGQIQNKQEFIASLTSGKSDFVTIDLSNHITQIFGNSAIDRSVWSAATNDNNKPGAVKLSISLVWQKQHHKWILIARQAVRV